MSDSQLWFFGEDYAPVSASGLQRLAHRITRGMGMAARLKNSERARARLLEENATMAEALEAILGTRPMSIHTLWGRKRCTEWPRCTHACGEGLVRAHEVADHALRDALGDEWTDKVHDYVAELVAMDAADGEEEETDGAA